MGLANQMHAEIYQPPQRIGVAMLGGGGGGGGVSVKMCWMQMKMGPLVH